MPRACRRLLGELLAPVRPRPNENRAARPQRPLDRGTQDSPRRAFRAPQITSMFARSSGALMHLAHTCLTVATKFHERVFVPLPRAPSPSRPPSPHRIPPGDRALPCPPVRALLSRPTPRSQRRRRDSAAAEQPHPRARAAQHARLGRCCGATLHAAPIGSSSLRVRRRAAADDRGPSARAPAAAPPVHGRARPRVPRGARPARRRRRRPRPHARAARSSTTTRRRERPPPPRLRPDRRRPRRRARPAHRARRRSCSRAAASRPATAASGESCMAPHVSGPLHVPDPTHAHGMPGSRPIAYATLYGRGVYVPV